MDKIDNTNKMNMRNTKQKNLILECLKENGGEHMTADNIIDALKSKKMPVAKSTVYRYLAYLEENGLVKKYIISEQQPACYQYLGNNETCLSHFHLMCQVCGQIVHFENAALQKVFDDIKNAKSDRNIKDIKDDGVFFIDGRKTVFYGICKSCMKE